MKKLGKHPTRREHELMYQWFENGCKSYKNTSDKEEDTPEGDEITFKTSAEGGLGITNVQ